MINEAIYAVIAVDTVMKLGMNHPMGPLTLADFIGPDVCHRFSTCCTGAWGDPKYRPCPLLRCMVAAGRAARASTGTEEKDVLFAFVIRHSAFRPRLSAAG